MTDFAILDVRPILAVHGDVFRTVMSAAEKLAPGQGLRLIVPFRPGPLIRVMEDRGFTACEGATPDGTPMFDFTPRAPAGRPPLAHGSTVEAAIWPEPSRSLDLSALDDNEAEARLFSALGEGTADDVLFAVTAAEPPVLLARLEAEGYAWAGNWAADLSGFRLLVRRVPAGGVATCLA